MKRPLLLRLLPESLRLTAFYKFYRGKHDRYRGLYQSASLCSAPNVTMELVPGDHISDIIAFTGIYETHLTKRVADLARQGGVLIDVGANLGYFPLLWAALNRGNRCFAFEASPRNIPLLNRNVKLNGLESQIDILPVAAGKEDGTLRFNLGPTEQTGWGGFAVATAEGGVDVDVVRVDQAISCDKPIALLKVDIEGADAWALMGSERLLKTKAVREVWFEQNKPRMQELGIPLNAAQDFLSSMGYSSSPNGPTASDLVEWTAIPNR
jgi:FkbM family methyltransferase